MRVRLLLGTMAVAALIASSATAAPATFFGEDVNLAGDPAQPAPVQSDAARNAFFSHLAGIGTESFESFPAGEEAILSSPFPGAGTATVLGGVVLGGENIAGRYPTSGEKYLNAYSTIRMDFSSPIAAFGFYATDVGDFDGHLTLQLTALSGEVVSLAVPAGVGVDGSTTGSLLFFGFYDLAQTYTSIFFDNGDYADIFGLDDFSIASASQVVGSPVPEPAVWASMTTGFVLLGSALRRRRYAHI